MDDEDRYSNSSGESERDNERDNEQDEVMEDADGGDNDADQDEGNNDEDNADEEQDQDDGDNEEDNENEGANESEKKAAGGGVNGVKTEDTADGSQNADNADDAESVDASTSRPKSSTPAPPPPLRMRPTVRPEALTAKFYDVIPTMAAPQSTSINAMAITPDLRYWMTGGSDGYIRKYDGASTINGKLQLTVAQKHPFVDSVTKAGVLMSYWENEEPTAPGRGDQEHILSPVYSLAVHSDALWLLSGLESGGINLQSVRHDEGKKIHCLQQHTNAVSVLTLAQDEKSVLSGAWDKNIFDWDLNTGQTKRSFDGGGGRSSAIELRPASGDPVPAEADEQLPTNTISTNNGMPFTNGVLTNGVNGEESSAKERRASPGAENGQASPAHESLFGGSDAGSLFGETAGEQPFGNDDDDYNTTMGMMPGHEGGMDHSADMAMAGMEMDKDPEKEPAPAVQPPTEVGGSGAEVSNDAMDIDTTTVPSQLETTQGPAETKTIGTTTQTESTAADAPQQETSQPDGASPPADASTQPGAARRSQSPMMLASSPPRQQFDPSQTSMTTFMSTAIDGTIRIWDKRVPNPVARIGIRTGVPPWCMGACWSPDGNMVYAGRRNGVVEEFDVRKAKRGWEPERTFKFPPGSGSVSAVRAMPNGRHLVCASHDILRMYDLQDPRNRSSKSSQPPFLVIPGNPRGGVTSSLYIDPTSRFMLSTAGTRGWEGTSTEVLIGYEINIATD